MHHEKTAPGWTLGLAALATFMVALDTLVVSTALTSIQRDLGASIAQLEWTVNGYNLAFAALVLAMGSLSDRFGRRPALILGLVGFAAPSAVGALVTLGPLALLQSH